MAKRKFRKGDLVTFRKDLLGVPWFSGIVLDVMYKENKCFVNVYWIDGCEVLEWADTIKLLARGKNGRSKIRKK